MATNITGITNTTSPVFSKAVLNIGASKGGLSGFVRARRRA